MSTIVKETTITSKGQVTVPIEWRRRFGDLKKFVWKETKTGLSLVPQIDEHDESNWVTVFDAERDNNGKGIDGHEFLSMLEKGL